MQTIEENVLPVGEIQTKKPKYQHAKFTSLPDIFVSAPSDQPNQLANSLMSMDTLYAQIPLTYDIEKERALTPRPPPLKEILDEEIFLDLSRDASLINIEEQKQHGFGHPSFNPEHSLFAKVHADLTRWTNKPHLEKVGIKSPHSSPVIMKEELKQVKNVFLLAYYNLIIGNFKNS